MLIVGADVIQATAGNRYLSGAPVEYTKLSPTGVVSVGEFVEVSKGTWEVHVLLQGKQYLKYKCTAQDLRKE